MRTCVCVYLRVYAHARIPVHVYSVEQYFNTNRNQLLTAIYSYSYKYLIAIHSHTMVIVQYALEVVFMVNKSSAHLGHDLWQANFLSQKLNTWVVTKTPWLPLCGMLQALHSV